MPTENSLNPAKGRAFQEQSRRALENHFGTEFRSDCPLAIGVPPKEHKFDLVSLDTSVVAECKNIKWTEGNNRPSAKMAQCNEAVFYLSFLPETTKKLLIINRDIRLHKNETLSHSYVSANKHLLRGVVVVEYDPTANHLIFLT